MAAVPTNSRMVKLSRTDRQVLLSSQPESKARRNKITVPSLARVLTRPKWIKSERSPGSAPLLTITRSRSLSWRRNYVPGLTKGNYSMERRLFLCKEKGPLMMSFMLEPTKDSRQILRQNLSRCLVDLADGVFKELKKSMVKRKERAISFVTSLSKAIRCWLS